MDKDSKGARSLVIKRGDTVVEQIAVQGRGVIERLLSACGDYTAHCVMSDGSPSQACEFSVCDLGFSLPVETPTRGKPWKITFTARNLSVVAVHLMNPKPPYDRYCVWLTEQDRRKGKATVRAGLVRPAGLVQVWVIGENKYGRLTREQEVVIVD